MRITEIFHSIQGEGRYAGTPSVFVRLTGCNLRCYFCDTPESSWKPVGEQRQWEDVLAQLLREDCKHVVVTGGEPFLQPEIVPLTQALHEVGRFITIETAGTVFRPVHADLMSISPKRANSMPKSGYWSARHEQLRENANVLRRMIKEYPYQLKYVIDSPDDLDDVERHLSQHPEIASENVFLMPQAVTAKQLHEKSSWLHSSADQMGYQVSPRLHIELFGNVPGT